MHLDDKLAEAGVTEIVFMRWYFERAAHAPPGSRSSSQWDRLEAMRVFECRIPTRWVTAARRQLPPDHPWRKLGPPFSTG